MVTNAKYIRSCEGCTLLQAVGYYFRVFTIGNGYLHLLGPRLAHLSTLDSGYRTLQSIDYAYDYNGNILNVSNNSGDISGMGGYYSNNHSYDNLNRLVASYGGGAGCYDMHWSYTPSGRLVSRRRIRMGGLIRRLCI